MTLLARLRAWLGGADEPARTEPEAMPRTADGFARFTADRLDALRARAGRSRRSRRAELPLLDALAVALAAGTLVRAPQGLAAELLAVATDEGAPPARRLAAARRAPELSAALLALAGSGFYATEVSCAGLEQAIMRVGAGGFRSAVLALIARDGVGAPPAPLARAVEASWVHAHRTATLARRLAPAFRADPEDCFSAAVLHDSGLACLATALGDARRRDAALPAPTTELLDRLRPIHEAVGALVAYRWGLGETIARAIGLHHRETLPPVELPVAETVFLADAADRAAERREPFDLEAIVYARDLAVSVEMASRVLAEPWWEG